MRLRRRLVFGVICGVALLWTAAGQQYAEAQPLRVGSVLDKAQAPAKRILRNTVVGFRLAYPGDWKVARQVVATEFAVGSTCQSVRIVDSAPDPDSGPGAKVLQSFVQICWKRPSSGESLAEFVEKTYGSRASSLLERAELGGISAYRTRGNGLNTTIFLQTTSHRVQIVTAVVAEQSRRAGRRAQVERILASFSKDP